MHDFLDALKVTFLSILSVFIAGFVCFYAFKLTNVLSYRLVVTFLALIFVSNSMARLLLNYFKNKK